MFTALALGQSRMLLDDGTHFSLRDPRLEQLRRLIEEANALVDAPPGTPLRISRYQADLWSELVALGVVTEQADRWQRIVTPLLDLDTLPDHDVPAGLRAELRPYQRDGFTWLSTLWELELGGILADDMGLGKTLQALALICHARERDPDGGTVPRHHADERRPQLGGRGGAVRARAEGRGGARHACPLGRGRSSRSRTATCVITTYALFRLEIDAYRRVPWAGLLLDEAQYVKNHRGKTYRCARELAAPFKLAITGTPMENNLMELWAMLSLTAPGTVRRPGAVRRALRAADRARQRLPSGWRGCAGESSRSSSGARRSWWPPNCRPSRSRPWSSTCTRATASSTTPTSSANAQKVLALLDDFDRNRFTILTSITRLRQLSLHPGLVDEAQRTIPCAKLSALVEQLDEVVSGGHRALVFSQFTQLPGQRCASASTRRASITATWTGAPAGATTCSTASDRAMPPCS